MYGIREILPSYLDEAKPEEKQAFFEALLALASADGGCDSDELEFITEAAVSHGIENIPQILEGQDLEKVLADVAKIKNRHLALELIREMCMLSHVDNVLSDNETLIIGKIGLAMNVELEKIEQISNWIIDHIIWLEQAKIIFEEKD